MYVPVINQSKGIIWIAATGHQVFDLSRGPTPRHPRGKCITSILKYATWLHTNLVSSTYIHVWYGMVWYCMYARDVCSIFHTHSTLQFYFSLLPTWTYLDLPTSATPPEHVTRPSWLAGSLRECRRAPFPLHFPRRRCSSR